MKIHLVEQNGSGLTVLLSGQDSGCCPSCGTRSPPAIAVIPGTLGICLLGGYGASADDLFAKNFTAAQAAAAKRLIAEIKGRTAIQKVSGHNDYAAKACPGFSVAAFLLED